jgi:hypothetical protein
VLGHDDGQGAQSGGAWELACLLVKGDPSVLFEGEQDGALVLIFLALAAERPSKVCSA